MTVNHDVTRLSLEVDTLRRQYEGAVRREIEADAAEDREGVNALTRIQAGLRQALTRTSAMLEKARRHSLVDPSLDPAPFQLLSRLISLLQG
jgi:hypothetical protein